MDRRPTSTKPTLGIICGGTAFWDMDYADEHPDALARGLMGDYERGRFIPYKPR